MCIVLHIGGSADGLRFVVPLKTLNAGPNSKYFGTGRGITLVNYTSDQFSGFKNIMVTGTLHDSLVVLEGLLNQETGLNSKELMIEAFAPVIAQLSGK